MIAIVGFGRNRYNEALLQVFLEIYLPQTSKQKIRNSFGAFLSEVSIAGVVRGDAAYRICWGVEDTSCYVFNSIV
ncbi:MAG: hypothetical protein ACFB2X_27600 [Rivularia sp. (in: cyanobacteria)]